MKRPPGSDGYDIISALQTLGMEHLTPWYTMRMRAQVYLGSECEILRMAAALHSTRLPSVGLLCVYLHASSTIDIF